MKVPTRRRWMVRIGAFATAITMAATAGLMNAAPALASTQIPCPGDIRDLGSLAQGGGEQRPEQRPDGIILVPFKKVRFTVVSATPTFFVSDSRFATNTLDAPISVTFTSLAAQTIIVTAAVGSQVKLTEKLQSTVNVTIQSQRTTSVGVNVQANVPPHSSVLGQYGVDGYSVTYDAQTILWYWWQNRCYDEGTQRADTNAPTVTEGWRVSTF
jgi:hypothetical protein